MTLASPGAYAALSFLCAAANGPVTNRCIIQHADGVNEVANVEILDWATNVFVPPAWTANSIINIADRTTTNANGGTPCLFSADFSLSDPSPVTNINVSWFK